MRFPENPLKILQLRDHITSSKMVVRGWYMTHFDRSDLLNSKKISLGGFCNLPDLCGPICEFSRFFRKFHPGPLITKNRFFYLSSPKKMFENDFFQLFLNFPKTLILKLHFGIFTFPILPVDQK